MMIITYYNITTIKREWENKKYFDAWNIFRKMENENFENWSLIDFFNESLKNIFNEIY